MVVIIVGGNIDGVRYDGGGVGVNVGMDGVGYCLKMVMMKVKCGDDNGRGNSDGIGYDGGGVGVNVVMDGIGYCLLKVKYGDDNGR